MFQSVFAEVVELAGYQHIIPPMFEDLGVFLRLGESTDVVTKEMYDFEDKGGRRIALRPEQTASVCRAFVEHRPTTPWKVWYGGPNFRYEKPQQGRFRQFDQVGIEALGVDDPLLDAEVIAIASRFYQRIGLEKVELLINTLGDEGDRERYVVALQGYFSAHLDQLSPESQGTLQKNPLRLLDSKRHQDQAVIAGAPSIREFLSPEAAEHFAAVLAALDAMNIAYTLSDRLVRGLDYYRRTTFEFVSTSLTAAHTALGGGGRYDGLVEQLGGPPTSGIGFAIGLDRTLLACDSEAVFPAPPTNVVVFVVDTADGLHATEICHLLRDQNISADRAFDNRSMKAQMKSADRSKASFAVIVGTDEVESGTVIIRPMGEGKQFSCARTEIVETIRTELKKLGS
jgi:histidyl-tRNA synthetase